MAVAARLAAKFNNYYVEKPGMPVNATVRGVLADMFLNSAHDDGYQRCKPTRYPIDQQRTDSMT